jgi:hypothetical protein
MDGQSSLKLLVLSAALALGLSACAACKAKPKDGAELHPTPDAPASTKPLSTTSRKKGFGAAGKFLP